MNVSQKSLKQPNYNTIILAHQKISESEQAKWVKGSKRRWRNKVMARLVK